MRHLVRHRFCMLHHRVDHRIGEPRERHARRVDHVYLRIPFLRDFLGERARRGSERALCRCAHRLVVEQDWVTITLAHRFADMRLAIEALAQDRAPAAARRLPRVVRLVFENLGKNITHEARVIVRCNKTEPRQTAAARRAPKIAVSTALGSSPRRRY